MNPASRGSASSPALDMNCGLMYAHPRATADIANYVVAGQTRGPMSLLNTRDMVRVFARKTASRDDYERSGGNYSGIKGDMIVLATTTQYHKG